MVYYSFKELIFTFYYYFAYYSQYIWELLAHNLSWQKIYIKFLITMQYQKIPRPCLSFLVSFLVSGCVEEDRSSYQLLTLKLMCSSYVLNLSLHALQCILYLKLNQWKVKLIYIVDLTMTETDQSDARWNLQAQRQKHTGNSAASNKT